jgi:hypothetical protein
VAQPAEPQAEGASQPGAKAEGEPQAEAAPQAQAGAEAEPEAEAQGGTQGKDDEQTTPAEAAEVAADPTNETREPRV